jgi:hypothetical protein
MKRTDADASVGGLYQPGNPATGLPSTEVGTSEMNNIQEELCNLIEYAGITLNGADYFQLKQAINILLAGSGVIKIGAGAGADYATLAAYLADAPANGDSLDLQDDEVITAKLTIPSNIKISQRKYKKLTTVTNLSEFIEFGDNVSIEGNLVIETSHTGTIGKVVIYNGDDNYHENIVIENKSTGTVTSAFEILASKKANYARGEVINSGAGSIANVLVDNSTELSNDLEIREK